MQSQPKSEIERQSPACPVCGRSDEVIPNDGENTAFRDALWYCLPCGVYF